MRESISGKKQPSLCASALGKIMGTRGDSQSVFQIRSGSDLALLFFWIMSTFSVSKPYPELLLSTAPCAMLMVSFKHGMCAAIDFTSPRWLIHTSDYSAPAGYGLQLLKSCSWVIVFTVWVCWLDGTQIAAWDISKRTNTFQPYVQLHFSFLNLILYSK